MQWRKVIGITLPHFYEGEATQVSEYLLAGMPVIHLRKPGCTAGQLCSLIEQIGPAHSSKIAVHNHFLPALDSGVTRFHLNGQAKEEGYSPASFTRAVVSTSAHSCAEMEGLDSAYSYAFLSPFFSSISKPGYTQNAALLSMAKPAYHGVATVPLGGINAENAPGLWARGFEYVAMCGALWN